jgi:hypothetical protein
MSSDKTRALSCQGIEVKVWDLKTGECLQFFNQETLYPGSLNETFPLITQIKITPDMKHALLNCVADDGSGFHTSELILIDLEKRLVWKLFHLHRTDTIFFDIAPDGTSAVMGYVGQLTYPRNRENVPREIKLLNFSALPEERLTSVANQCLNPVAVNQELTQLPQFAQHRIRALQANLSFEESIQIYTAQTALPTIRGFLMQALRESNLAIRLVSEAFARINNLPAAIRDRVMANFAAIQFINEDQIQAGIEAINQTLAEFEAQIPSPQARVRKRKETDD